MSLESPETDNSSPEDNTKKIYFNGYTGINSNKMQLNDQVAQRFMWIADMRYHIAFETMHKDRVELYPQVGEAMVETRRPFGLKLPAFNPNLKTRYSTIIKDEDTWVVGIDDQLMFKDVVAKEPTTSAKRDEFFYARFSKTVSDSVGKCLFQEKVFNGNRFHYAF